MALVQVGHVSAGEWADALGSAIRRAQAAGDPDDGSTYYGHVLDALEAVVADKALTTRDALFARKEAWRAAYASTPHGRPVELRRSGSTTNGGEGSVRALNRQAGPRREAESRR